MNILSAGKYWIGDLCYVIHGKEWEEFCDKMENLYPTEAHIITLDSGVKVAFASTGCGDGSYYHNLLTQFAMDLPVDSGLIGCIKLDDLNLENPEIEDNLSLGLILDFEKDFKVSKSKDDTIAFGHFQVYTGEEEETYDFYE